MLPSSAQSDLSHLHRHLLDIKSLVSAMSAAGVTASVTAGAGAGGGVSSPSRHPSASVSSQTDDRLVVAVKQSDSSTL